VIRDGAALVVRRGPFLVRVRSGSESAWAGAASRQEVSTRSAWKRRTPGHLALHVTRALQQDDRRQGAADSGRGKSRDCQIARFALYWAIAQEK